MFDIRIVSRTPEPQDGGWDALAGEIRIGEYRERFRVPLVPWTPAAYERHWREAAERLLAGRPAGFWTVPWQFWWVAWPEGGEAVWHEQRLTAERLRAHARGPGPSAGVAPHELIGARDPHTEDGVPYSEWRVPLAAVRAWLPGLAPASAPA